MEDRIFETSVRVRYKETDQMGVVHHTNYIVWFEVGRTDLLRQLGLSYRDLEQRGILLPVVDLPAVIRRLHAMTTISGF